MYFADFKLQQFITKALFYRKPQYKNTLNISNSPKGYWQISLLFRHKYVELWTISRRRRRKNWTFLLCLLFQETLLLRSLFAYTLFEDYVLNHNCSGWPFLTDFGIMTILNLHFRLYSYLFTVYLVFNCWKLRFKGLWSLS